MLYINKNEGVYMSDKIIEIKNLNKQYKMFKRKKDRLLEAVCPWYKNHETFSALQDFDLTLEKGEILGILRKKWRSENLLY